jgi:hypothetical protein
MARPPLDRPFADEERARLERAVARLAHELGRAIATLGEDARPQRLARATKLGMATVHRVLALAKTARGEELAALEGAPGADALEAFAAALGKSSLPRKLAGELDLAIAQYRKALRELGGSKTVVLGRTRATTAGAAVDPDARERRDRAIRERMFSDAAELLGRHTETRLDIMMFRPSGKGGDLLDFAQVRGLIGHRGRADGLPTSVDLLGRARMPDGEPDPALLTLDGAPAGAKLSSALLAEFSTDPPPIVLSQGLGARVRNVVDPAFVEGGAAVDFVVGFQRRGALLHPRLEDTPTLEVGALHRDPMRNLIIDVYLERSVAHGAIADLAVYVWSPTLEASLADHWTERLTTGHTLQVLGAPGARARTRAYPRHDELTAHAFKRLGWSPTDFVGWRAEIEYPLWGGAYFVTFDYGTWHIQRPSLVPCV